MANAERCVCCGCIIPEGSHVCPNCKVAVIRDENGDAYAFLVKYMKENMEKKPTQKRKKKDLVEVVRCKGCKNRNEHRYCRFFGESVSDNDFCSHGERKEDGK